MCIKLNLMLCQKTKQYSFKYCGKKKFCGYDTKDSIVSYFPAEYISIQLGMGCCFIVLAKSDVQRRYLFFTWHEKIGYCLTRYAESKKIFDFSLKKRFLAKLFKKL